MKRIISILLICLLMSACSSTESGASNKNGNGKNNVSESSAAGNPVEAQDTIEPEPFSLYPAYLQLPLGQHVTLDADTAPVGKKLVWSSSNPSVAAVDENGRITPVAEGETIINCAVEDDPSLTAACGVLVVADGNIYLWDEEE